MEKWVSCTSPDLQGNGAAAKRSGCKCDNKNKYFISPCRTYFTKSTLCFSAAHLFFPLYLKRILVLDDENINVCHWYVKQVLRAFDDQPSKHLSSLVRLFGSLPWVSCKHTLLVGSCGGFLCSLLLAASPAAPDVSGCRAGSPAWACDTELRWRVRGSSCARQCHTVPAQTAPPWQLLQDCET